jgi:hypothetical protein
MRSKSAQVCPFRRIAIGWNAFVLNCRLAERFYLGGDSSFDAEPVGPVVVFGIPPGFPLAPPELVMPDPPPELVPLVVPPCIAPLFMAPLVIGAFSLFAELLVGPVLAPA